MKSFENNRFEGIVSISLVLAFILVLVTGILSFVRLNSIIYTVDKAIHPDYSLSMVKDISNDLIRAENRVKSYNLTRNEADMVRYNELMEIASTKMKDLQEKMKNDRALSPYMDTLNILVEEKFDILDMLLIIKEEYPVENAMEGILMDIYLNNKPGISVIPKDSLTVDEITLRLKKAQQDAVSEERIRNEQELEWTRYDKLIMDRINRLIANLELRETANLKLNTGLAEKEAAEVKTIISTFGLALLFLLLLAGIVIYLYVRRNNEYRRILKKAKADAEELALAKQRFLANMSHEIKTPMNVISGYLRQILQSPLDQQQREQLEIVKKSSDHLLQLLNDLLDLSRLQANKLELIRSDFSPGDLVRDMHQWFTPAASEKNLHFMVEIHPEVPVLVSGDPVRLRQILFNLAGNAIKFTDQGIVTLTLSPGTGTGEKTTLVFEVSDTGPGISSEDQDKIFTEFGQGNAVSAKRSEGAGLGLAITSGLVELMGGAMKVTSSPGKGSAFRVELPFEPASGDGVPPLTEKLPVNELDGLRILVVDDEAYNRGLLKLILGKYNCEVIEASDGFEAVSLAREKQPDLVLMDIHMPGMSGTDAAYEISRAFSGSGKEMPVIALSAAITAEEKERYRQSGIADCISKPFEEEQLLNAILGMIHKTGISSVTIPGVDNPEADRHVPAGTGYNLESLRASCGGNTSFFREMVEMFLKNTETGLKEMEGLIAAGSWDELAGLAHKISPPCRHLKAETLYSFLKQIEQQAAAREQKLAGTALEQAREEFDRIKSDILARSEFKTR